MTVTQCFRQLLTNALHGNKSAKDVDDLPMYFRQGQTYYPLVKLEIGKIGLTDVDAVIFSAGLGVNSLPLT